MSVVTFRTPKNNAYGTLAASIASGDGSLSLATGQGARFPAADFWATLYTSDPALGEIVLCTARTDDALTVTRAQQSTSAQNWAAGTLCRLLVTAQQITDIQSALTDGTDELAIGALGVTGAISGASATISTTAGLIFSATGSNVIGASHASGALVFQTGGANTRVTIASGGGVTIAGAITAQSTLDVAGLATFSGTGGNAPVSSAAIPSFRLYESDQAADSRVWRWLANGGVMYLIAQTDALSGDKGIRMTRSGAAVTDITLDSTALTVVGAITAPSATMNTTTGLTFSATGSNVIKASHASGALIFQTGGANTRVTIASDGNVTLTNNISLVSQLAMSNQGRCEVRATGASGGYLVLSTADHGDVATLGSTAAFEKALSSTVSLSARKYLTTQATAPTIAANQATIGNGATSGYDATATIASGSTDVAGRLIFTCGDGAPTDGKAVSVTFNSAYASAPKSVTLTPYWTVSGYDAAVHTYSVDNITTTGFDVYMGVAPTSEASYSYFYQVIA